MASQAARASARRILSSAHRPSAKAATPAKARKPAGPKNLAELLTHLQDPPAGSPASRMSTSARRTAIEATRKAIATRKADRERARELRINEDRKLNAAFGLLSDDDGNPIHADDRGAVGVRRKRGRLQFGVVKGRA